MSETRSPTNFEKVAYSTQHLSKCKHLQQAQALCKVCSAIDLSVFGPASLVVGEHGDVSSKPPISLGQVKDITERAPRCTFCSLLVQKGRLNDEHPEHSCDIVIQPLCSFERCKGESLYHHMLFGLTVRLNPLPNVKIENDEVYHGPFLPLSLSTEGNNQMRTLLDLQPQGTQTISCLASSPNVRPIARPVGQNIDFDVLRKWISRCRKKHKTCSKAYADSARYRVKGLKLIDVTRMCVVDAPSEARYVALSYVCGRTIHLLEEALTSRPDLSRRHALNKLQLPATIQDAITVTCELGEKFLWIDALCIPQHDPTLKAKHINQMDIIYRRGCLTIVAASGNDATDGLPGVPPKEREISQHHVRLSNASFVTVIEDSNCAGTRGSSWHRRSWTLQEDVFSDIKLIWTEEIVYWLCLEAEWCEEFNIEDLNDRSLTRRLHLYPARDLLQEQDSEAYGLLSSRNRRRYAHLRNAFLERRMTRSADMLNAFAGIMREFSEETQTAFIWGLTEQEFTMSLLWNMPNRPRNFEISVISCLDGSLVSRPFPSWSWAAWTVPVEPYISSFSNMQVLNQGIESMLIIYRQSVDGRWARIEEDISYQNKPQSPCDIQSKWMLYPRDANPESLGTVDDTWIDSGLLQFWTSTSVAFITARSNQKKIRGHDDQSFEYEAALELTDFEAFAGDISELSKDSMNQYVFYIRGDAKGYAPLVHKDQVVKKDVMVVAKESVGADDSGDSGRHWLKVLFFDRYDGICYRAGIGTIRERDWISMERKWELIMFK